MNFLETSNNSNILSLINTINTIISFIRNDMDYLSIDKINIRCNNLLDLHENLNFLLNDENPNLVNHSKELLFTNFLEGLKHIGLIKEHLNIQHSLDKISIFNLFLTTYLNIYKLLFEHGLNPNQQDEDGKTILIHLCQNIKNHSILVQSLMLILEFNPEKDIKDYFCNNAIHYLMINNAIKNDGINIILNILDV
jgi:hypothetical protein